MKIVSKIGNKIRRLYRSAITGRFVSKAYALLNPKTTTEEKRK
jgi:hypothetical protein